MSKCSSKWCHGQWVVVESELKTCSAEWCQIKKEGQDRKRRRCVRGEVGFGCNVRTVTSVVKKV